MTKLTWHTEKRKVSELTLFDGNPRKMSEKQAQDLMTSLKRFNLVEIPVIDQNNRVIAGNMRIQALKTLGRDSEEIEVRVPSRDLTEEEAREYLLRSNRNTGEWDYDLLANFDEDFLKDIGWENEELDEIFGLEMDDEFNEEKELEKVLAGKERRVKEGDLWQLGTHFLYIGDATKRESWEKVLGNERFDFLFTDPPYKLVYEGKRKRGFGFKQQRKYLGVEKMGRIPEYDEWLSIANEFQNPQGVNIMIFECWRNTVSLWQALEKYWKIRNMIIWWLPNRSQGFTAMHKFFNKYDIAPLAGEGILNEEYEEELENYLKEKGQKLLDTNEIILYGQKGESFWYVGRTSQELKDKKFQQGKTIKKSRWAKITDHITWNADDKSSQNIIFGTKPIQILVPYIKILSPRDGIVMEPFCGSGGTIIASEIMKRKCRAIELSDIYAEVILNRFEKFTGLKAELITETTL